MEVYNSEQEQVEALKAWWDKNGRSALLALGVFLMSVLGWQAWDEKRQQEAANASGQFQKMSILMGSNATQAVEVGRSIIANHAGSIYAVMASMSLAKLAIEDNDLSAATAHLRYALAQSDQPELTELARLRLARVEFAQGKADAALATLAAGNAGAAGDELRGDILLSQSKKNEARDAYTKALAAYGDAIDKRDLVQMKLDDLAEKSAE